MTVVSDGSTKRGEGTEAVVCYTLSGGGDDEIAALERENWATRKKQRLDGKLRNRNKSKWNILGMAKGGSKSVTHDDT
jgi:hypothetical protein